MGHSSTGLMIAVAVLVSGCTGSAAPRALPTYEVLGEPTGGPLDVQAAPDAHPVVTRRVAYRAVQHPFAAPAVTGLRQFGLGYVTVDGLTTQGSEPPPAYQHRLAWIGIYEIDNNGDHSCPGQPQPTPTPLPPLHTHYYFAVLIDATTGRTATWTEDESGLLLRQCLAPNH